MEITFRKATKQDTPTIAVLADTIWKKHYPAIITLEQIDYMLDSMYSEPQLLKQMDEGHEFTIAYLNHEPAGYISLSTTDKQNYFLHKFYVLTQDHRKGIGSALLNYALMHLQHPHSIELTVNRKNFKAINFYFKNGFTIKEVADFDIGNGFFMNDFIMIKKF